MFAGPASSGMPLLRYYSLSWGTLLYESFAFARQRAKKLCEEAGEARRRPEITKITKNLKIAIFKKKVIHLEVSPTLRIFQRYFVYPNSYYKNYNFGVA